MAKSMWRRRSFVLPFVAVTAALATVTTMAVAYQGEPSAKVDVNEGGVWITKQQALTVGHVNESAQVIDGAARTTVNDFDVLQSGTDVVLTTPDDMSLVNPVDFTIGDKIQLPKDSRVFMGGQTLAVQSLAEGKVWVFPVERLNDFSPDAPATFDIGPNGAVAVGRDGTVHAVSASNGTLTEVAVEGGNVRQPNVRTLQQGKGSDKLQVTSVGSQAVIFDGKNGDVFTADSKLATVKNAKDALLQQPSDENASAYIATKQGLYTVPFSGAGASEKTAPMGGDPAAPVWMNGCVYGAWSGTLQWIRACADNKDDLTQVVPEAAPEAHLTYRVNRNSVMLNDVVTGVAWMSQGDLQKVDNWNDATPPDGESDEKEKSAMETPETSLPDRTDVNTPPLAVDDEFGARAGRSTILTVLDNDSDSDGDVLTTSLVGAQPRVGTVAPVFGGQAMQLDLPADAQGTITFTYQDDDGRGGKATALVTVHIVPSSENNAPKYIGRDRMIPVEVGASVTYNLLPDWRDPDGDDILLQAATVDDGNEVTFTPDGKVTFKSLNGKVGQVKVNVVLSDGTASAEGSLMFDVRPEGSTTPFTNPDHVTVTAGETATVKPLENDISGGVQPLRLALVSEQQDATIVPDYSNESFTFTSNKVGTTYVTYLAAAGAATTVGLVRVDVVERKGEDAPPIAVRDTALLPSGSDVLVAVLANDVDPSDGVLVLQSVEVPDNAGISVAVLGNETLRITDTGHLGSQVALRYTVSNGKATAVGDVIVIPVPTPADLAPPVANNDEALVRVGDVVTANVLSNDYSPVNAQLKLSPDLLAPLPSEQEGKAFVSGDSIRFRAGDKPGSVTVHYEVVDSYGQRASASLVITVMAMDEASNQPPVPKDLTVRAIAGNAVNVIVPLDRIDPDGDSVEVVGVTKAPSLGRITGIKDNVISYQALPGAAGPDTFTYSVRDRLGAVAQANVRVGVAPPQSLNQAPYAVKDSLSVRPGKKVAVPVLANDSDPDGDAISLKGKLVVPDVPGLAAKVDKEYVVITAPSQPVRTSVQYEIQDSRGATSIGVIDIQVSDDVPLQPPVARDDRVRVEDISKEMALNIDVLANDSDPDGTTDDLKVTTSDPEAKVSKDRHIQATVTTKRQLIEYTITDADNMSATAYVFVPALSDLAPVLDDAGVAGVSVQAGQTVSLPLRDYVRTATGGAVSLADRDSVSAVRAAPGAPLVTDDSTLTYTAREDYAGPDAITFQVKDASPPVEGQPAVSTLSLPVTVIGKPSQNTPPTLSGTSVTVARGEQAARVNLRALTADADKGDLERVTYQRVDAPPAGIQADVQGNDLVVSAGETAAVGAAGSVRVSATDGKSDPVVAEVQVTVAETTKPLAVAVEDTATTKPGQRVRLKVLANDMNPYTDRPLKLISATSNSTWAEVTTDGDEVVVTPREGSSGTIVGTYRITDASGSANRQVDGRFVVNVEGPPSAPGTPAVSGVQSGRLTLSWSAPLSNGAPITGYIVTSADGSIRKECPSTTCVIDGLNNGTNYRFQVVAVSRLGESVPSPQSQSARPEGKPEAPSGVSAVANDASATVNWQRPNANGSQISGYVVRISPTPQNGQTEQRVSGTSMTWSGLTNGASYTFQVKAVGSVEGDFSANSAAVTPSGRPSAPAAPTVTVSGATGDETKVTVSWSAPSSNGSQIQRYSVKKYQGGTERSTLSGITSTSASLTLTNSSTGYYFRVLAENARGASELSPASREIRAFGAPSAPSNLEVQPADSAVIVSNWDEAAPNGADPGDLSYRVSTSMSDDVGTPVTKGQRLEGFRNGDRVDVRVRAVVIRDGITYAGPWSAVSSATPFGGPAAPTLRSRPLPEGVEISWEMGAPNGRNVDGVAINENNAGWQELGKNPQLPRVISLAPGQTYSVQIKTYYTSNIGIGIASVSQIVSLTYTRPELPKYHNVSLNKAGGDRHHGYVATLNLTGGPPNSSVTITCQERRDGTGDWNDVGTNRITVGPNGSFDAGCRWSRGFLRTTDGRVAVQYDDGKTLTTNWLTWSP